MPLKLKFTMNAWAVKKASVTSSGVSHIHDFVKSVLDFSMLDRMEQIKAQENEKLFENKAKY